MTNTPEPKTQTLPEKIAERIEAAIEDWLEGDIYPEFPAREVAALIREELAEIVQIMESIYAGVGDDVRAILHKKDPMHVISIPVLYGALQRLRAALNELRNEGKNG